MQGRLRNEPLTVTISTRCAHCGQPLHLVVDHELRSHVEETKAEPLIFEPQLDWASFKEPNIVHAY